MARVEVENVSKTYGAAKVLDGITMDFPDGGLFGLLGPSGSGKTTLLRAIAGFIYPDAGSIRIGGTQVETIPVERREIGMMFQSYALFPNMSVFDNVGFGLRVRKVSAEEERRRVRETLDLVQLRDLEARRPHQLSGGQQQRVALARAIVTNPRVLLLDEPLSALDKALRLDMQIELKRIQREVGITTIFVTHDQEEALTLSDKIGILKDGRMIQAGSPKDVYNRPVNTFAAGFLGDANLLPGRAEGEHFRLDDGTLIDIPADESKADLYAVRPENVSISVDEPDAAGVNKIRAKLTERIFSGAMATCLVTWQDQGHKVLAREQELEDLPASGLVWLSWPPEKTMPLRLS
ncbi:MAG: ABC transporter ATP-binding protein [Geminicoccaceae bacterium]